MPIAKGDFLISKTLFYKTEVSQISRVQNQDEFFIFFENNNFLKLNFNKINLKITISIEVSKMGRDIQITYPKKC